MIGCAPGGDTLDETGGASGDGGSGAVTGATRAPGVTSGSGAESTTTSTGSGFESTGSGMPPAGCEGNAGDIDLISKPYDLQKLVPASLELTKIGALACLQNGGVATPPRSSESSATRCFDATAAGVNASAGVRAWPTTSRSSPQR